MSTTMQIRAQPNTASALTNAGRPVLSTDSNIAPTGNARGGPILRSLDEYLADIKSSGLLGVDTDLAFLVMAEQIRDLNKRIHARIKDIRFKAKAREVLGKRLDELRAFKTKLSDNGNGDTTKVHNYERYTHGNPLSPALADPQFKHLWRRQDLVVDQNNGSLHWKEKGPIAGNATGITADDVNVEIKRLEDQAQQLDSDRDIGLVELNSDISKKANVVELLSNIEKKTHESQRSVIGNLR